MTLDDRLGEDESLVAGDCGVAFPLDHGELGDYLVGGAWAPAAALLAALAYAGWLVLS